MPGSRVEPAPPLARRRRPTAPPAARSAPPTAAAAAGPEAPPRREVCAAVLGPASSENGMADFPAPAVPATRLPSKVAVQGTGSPFIDVALHLPEIAFVVPVVRTVPASRPL